MKKTTFSTVLSVFFFLFSVFFSNAQDIGNAPDWKWIRSIGGSGGDNGTDVAVDASGNVYVVGVFNGITKIGGIQINSFGINDGFLAKFSPDGTALWVKNLHTNNADGKVFCQNVALDNAGNVVVSGHFQYGDLLLGVFVKQRIGNTDIFVAKFNSSGDIIWDWTFGVLNNNITAQSLAIDDADNIYCLGSTQLFKLNPTGIILWQTIYFSALNSGAIYWNNGRLSLGGTFNSEIVIDGTLLSSQEDAIYMCAVDPQIGSFFSPAKMLESSYFFGGYLLLKSMIVKGPDEIYLAGQYQEEISAGTCSVTSAFLPKGFIAKMGSAGCQWLVGETTSNLGENAVYKIALDANGNLYGCGNTNTAAITFGNLNLPAGSNGFLAKIDVATGSVIDLKGSSEFTISLVLDGANNVYETGFKGTGGYLKKSSSAGLPVYNIAFENNGGFCQVSSVESDGTGIYVMASVFGKIKFGAQTLDFPTSSMLVAKFSLDGTQLLWYKVAEGVSGVYFSWGGSVSYLDKTSGNFYCSGVFSTTFTYNGQTYTNPNANGNSYFLLQTGPGGSAGWLKVFSSIENLLSVTTDNAGNIILGGTFSNTATFGNVALTEKGGGDFFVLKLDKNGDELWAKRGGGNDTEFSSITSTDAQNNIYFVAETYSYDLDFNDSWSLSTADGDGNIMFGKLTPDGDVSWVKIYGKSANDEYSSFATGLKTDPAGNTYMGGYYGQSNEFGSITITSPYSVNHFVAKFNADGIPQWVSPIRSKRFVFNYYEMDIDEQGNAYYASQLRDSMFIENNALSRQGTPFARNFFIARFNNSNGSLDWAKVMSGGPEAAGFPTAMAVHDHNSMICAGTFIDRMEFDDFQINSYSSNAGYLGLLGVQIMVSVQTPVAGKTMLELSPNPAAGFTTIGAENTIDSPVKVNIVDSQGKVVFQQEYQGIAATQQIDLQHLVPGVYFLNVQFDNASETKRLVIAR